MQVMYAGVDVGRDSYHVRVEDSTGRLIASSEFANSHQGARALLEWLVQHRPAPSVPVLVATEGLRGWASPLDRYVVEAEGFHYVPLVAKRVDEHRCHFPEDITDSGDAAVIVDLLRTQVTKGTARVCTAWDQTLEDLRVCARTFQQVTEGKTRNQNELRAFCEEFLPDYLRDERLPDLDHGSLPALLEWCPDPAELAKRPHQEVVEFLHRVSRGHLKPQTAAAFQEVAAAMGIALSKPLQDCLRILVARLRQDKDQIHELEKRLKDLLNQLPYAREILAWKGVGARTLGCYLGQAGDLSRFENEPSCARTSGVAPMRNQSGHKDRRQKGTRYDRRMKRALFLMAESRVRFDPESAAYYNRKLCETKNHYRAIKGLARYLARRIYNTYQRYAAPETLEALVLS